MLKFLSTLKVLNDEELGRAIVNEKIVENLTTSTSKYLHSEEFMTVVFREFKLGNEKLYRRLREWQWELTQSEATILCEQPRQNDLEKQILFEWYSENNYKGLHGRAYAILEKILIAKLTEREGFIEFCTKANRSLDGMTTVQKTWFEDYQVNSVTSRLSAEQPLYKLLHCSEEELPGVIQSSGTMDLNPVQMRVLKLKGRKLRGLLVDITEDLDMYYDCIELEAIPFIPHWAHIINRAMSNYKDSKSKIFRQWATLPTTPALVNAHWNDTYLVGMISYVTKNLPSLVDRYLAVFDKCKDGRHRGNFDKHFSYAIEYAKKKKHKLLLEFLYQVRLNHQEAMQLDRPDQLEDLKTKNLVEALENKAVKVVSTILAKKPRTTYRHVELAIRNDVLCMVEYKLKGKSIPPIFYVMAKFYRAKKVYKYLVGRKQDPNNYSQLSLITL